MIRTYKIDTDSWTVVPVLDNKCTDILFIEHSIFISILNADRNSLKNYFAYLRSIGSSEFFIAEYTPSAKGPYITEFVEGESVPSVPIQRFNRLGNIGIL